MLGALRRDGIAGVWGVLGDIRSPGEDEFDIDVPDTMGGTLESCRLDELEDRCSISDDDMESVRAMLESRIRWNLDKAALVLRLAASVDGPSVGV